MLDKSVSRTPLGGAALTRASAAMLSSAAAAKGAKLLARHMFRRVPVEGYNKFEVRGGGGAPPRPRRRGARGAPRHAVATPQPRAPAQRGRQRPRWRKPVANAQGAPPPSLPWPPARRSRWSRPRASPSHTTRGASTRCAPHLCRQPAPGRGASLHDGRPSCQLATPGCTAATQPGTRCARPPDCLLPAGGRASRSMRPPPPARPTASPPGCGRREGVHRARRARGARAVRGGQSDSGDVRGAGGARGFREGRAAANLAAWCPSIFHLAPLRHRQPAIGFRLGRQPTARPPRTRTPQTHSPTPPPIVPAPSCPMALS